MTTRSESYFSRPLERIQIQEVVYASKVSSGQTVTVNNNNQAGVGKQIVTPITIKNYQNKPQEYYGIVTILDKDGVAVYVEWQNGIVQAGQTVVIDPLEVQADPWVPGELGEYTLSGCLCGIP